MSKILENVVANQRYEKALLLYSLLTGTSLQSWLGCSSSRLGWARSFLLSSPGGSRQMPLQFQSRGYRQRRLLSLSRAGGSR
ncbi:unnamed protein product [Pleuronectes platessa]|uniref:Uncharacterized protein n=1 Tax=Pleuronectes platessa TaxID=8262 RepID=A0A9N7YS05_PLEPL|nr:unnamed protein product [Pleuronectes platessa]